MLYFIKKSKKILAILLTIPLLTIYHTQAQSVTANDNNILSLSMECPNNPQCIYSGQDPFLLDILITNNSDQNIEIPLEAIRAYLSESYLKDIQTGEPVGPVTPPGLPLTDLLKKLTLLPAHTSHVTRAEFSKKGIKKAFKKAHSNRIAFYKSIVTSIHYQGSKEPIGSYENGKFERKSFVLEAEKVITKK
ncbi:unnamed protein product [Commensalibacter communis]|uniref:hypothetical protein n=1 Tax=Commensalibacter communis TaxID=2972786 RepID=UPI0022FFA9F2|nr:hypothetical protein [Commensalibacter communis]CAI3950250.1 unnamed protein product [Commensalibacter communis]